MPLSPFSLQPSDIVKAHQRIAPLIHRTPLVTSHELNTWLGHTLIFKLECMQKTGAFKARGALNTLLSLQEQNALPKSVTAFSSGNHAQAVAWACQKLGVKATIFLPEFASPIKIQATRSYGADVVLAKSRQEAEALTAKTVEEGALFIHPFDDDRVIAGQGTACYEALSDGVKPDAVFAPCGGGGLLSGTFLAARYFSPDINVFAGEPAQANDASISYKTGKIFSFNDSPPTLADGARTLHVSERTFHYLQQLNGFFEVSERDMVYWAQWLNHVLKFTCEPTSAVAMGAASAWLKTQEKPRTVLVIVSGGNIAPETYHTIWQENYLTVPPLRHC